MQKFNGNAAYDLDLFAPKAENKRQAGRRRPRPKVEEPRISTFQAIKIIVLSSIVLALVATMIYGRVQLTELNTEVSKIESDMKVAKSENTRLSMELNSLVSLDRVEEYAINVLGMRKMEKYQMEYIDVSMENKFEFLNKSKNGIALENVNAQLKKILEETF